MSTIKRTFHHLGEKVTVELTLPTNKEHNEYAARRIKVDDSEKLIAFRVEEFDRFVVKSSRPKEEIFDAAKSSFMFHLFENFEIDEKN